MVKIIIEIPNFLQPMLPPGLKKNYSQFSQLQRSIYDNNIDNINIDNDSDKNNEDNSDMIIMIFNRKKN